MTTPAPSQASTLPRPVDVAASSAGAAAAAAAAAAASAAASANTLLSQQSVGGAMSATPSDTPDTFGLPLSGIRPVSPPVSTAAAAAPAAGSELAPGVDGPAAAVAQRAAAERKAKYDAMSSAAYAALPVKEQALLMPDEELLPQLGTLARDTRDLPALLKSCTKPELFTLLKRVHPHTTTKPSSSAPALRWAIEEALQAWVADHPPSHARTLLSPTATAPAGAPRRRAVAAVEVCSASDDDESSSQVPPPDLSARRGAASARSSTQAVADALRLVPTISARSSPARQHSQSALAGGRAAAAAAAGPSARSEPRSLRAPASSLLRAAATESDDEESQEDVNSESSDDDVEPALARASIAPAPRVRIAPRPGSARSLRRASPVPSTLTLEDEVASAVDEFISSLRDGLTAEFLAGVRPHAGGRSIRDVFKWDIVPGFKPAHVHTGKELIRLATVLDHLLRGDVGLAAQSIIGRMAGLQTAGESGSWDMCDAIEDAAGSTAFVPAAALKRAFRQVEIKQRISRLGESSSHRSSASTRPRGGSTAAAPSTDRRDRRGESRSNTRTPSADGRAGAAAAPSGSGAARGGQSGSSRA